MMLELQSDSESDSVSVKLIFSAKQYQRISASLQKLQSAVTARQEAVLLANDIQSLETADIYSDLAPDNESDNLDDQISTVFKGSTEEQQNAAKLLRSLPGGYLDCSRH
jgi:hypothetical protein